jgi:hypothetical protein
MVIVLLTPTNIAPTSAAAARAANAPAPCAALGFGIWNYCNRNRNGGQKCSEKSAAFWGCIHFKTSLTFEMFKGDRPAPDLKAPGKFVVL